MISLLTGFVSFLIHLMFMTEVSLKVVVQLRVVLEWRSAYCCAGACILEGSVRGEWVRGGEGGGGWGGRGGDNELTRL